MEPSSDAVWTAAIAASLLRRGRALAVVAGVVLVAAFGASLASVLFGQKLLALGFAATLLPGLVSLWFAFRTALDADLFDAIARHGDLAAFDRAMLALGLMKADHAGRPLEARVEGALHLLRQQAVAVGIQMLMLVFSAVFFAVSMPSIGSR
jgi:hypothetical protein